LNDTPDAGRVKRVNGQTGKRADGQTGRRADGQTGRRLLITNRRLTLTMKPA
jgi:hypothetical protein